MRIRLGKTVTALLAIAAAGGWRTALAGNPALEYHPNTTRKMLQLIGDTDWPLRHATITQTYSKAHLYGTDLGEPFEHQGKLYLAFGDSDGGNGGDSLGFTSATKPSELSDFDCPKDASNVYIPIKIGSYPTGSYDTPSGGISLNGAIYIAYATESDSYPASKENNRRGILGKSTDGGKTWTYLYTTDYAPGTPPDFTYHHFIRNHMEKVAAADYPGLPWTSGDVVLIYGMSHDGNVDPNPDDIYLAAVPADQFESGKSAWMYFKGLDRGNPTWSATEADAVPILSDGGHDGIEIFYFPLLDRWMGAYRSGTYHLADKPWGPFSPAGDWLDTAADDLAANIFHVAWTTAYKDGFYYVSNGNPQPQNEDGKIYSMHVIPRFCRGTQDACEMYYTLSTWNPYVPVIMRTEIGLPQPNEPAVSQSPTLMPGDSSWNMTSSTFFKNVTKFGKPAISTSNDAQGVASTGLMWRWLPRDYWNQELSFTVSGGCQDANGAEVILLEGGGDLPTSGNIATIYTNIKNGVYGNVVRDSWGIAGNLVPTDTPVDCTWSLKPFDRSNLKVAIIDDLNRAWGYIDVSQMTLDRNVPTVGTAVSTVTPGDTAWTLSPGAWHTTVNHGGVDYFQTSTGDPTSKGVAWRWLPRDWKNKQLDFQLLGGDARVLLVQGVEPIPVDGDMDTLWTALQAGDYGRMCFSAQGPNNNTTPTPVSWDLTTADSDKLKLVILDDVTDSWGFISVSPMQLTRYNTGNLPPAFTSDPIIKGNATIGVGYTGNIHVNASDPNAGDSLTYAKLDGPSWLSMGAAGNFGSALSIPSITDMGLNQWHVRVKDAENAYDDAILRITVADRAPAFATDPLTRPNAKKDELYSSSIAGQATDPDPGDTVTYSKTSGHDWLHVASDGTLSGTPRSGDVGPNSFLVRATDSGGLTDEATLNIHVLGPSGARFYRQYQ